MRLGTIPEEKMKIQLKKTKKVIKKAVPQDLEEGNNTESLPPAGVCILEDIIATTIPDEAGAEVLFSPPPTTSPRAEVRNTPQPPPPPPATRSKDPHLHMPHIKPRITAPDPEKSKYSRTKIVKKWLETEKTANGTFKITKCTKFSEPTVSTNIKRKKLTICEKAKKIQERKFKNFFTSCIPGLPKSGIKRKCDVLQNNDLPVVKKATTQSSVTNLKKKNLNQLTVVQNHHLEATTAGGKIKRK